MSPERKYSRKRELILNYLSHSSEHPSAETIYKSLKPELPDLSLGTVYRNLSVFQDDGLVRRVCSVNGQERYDADVSAHPHFVCAVCGRVIDVEMGGVSVDIDKVSALNGVDISRMDVTFYGICSECK